MAHWGTKKSKSQALLSRASSLLRRIWSMGLLLAEEKFSWNSQSLRTGLVRKGFSEEGGNLSQS